MYNRILVTLDTTPTDRAVLDHIRPLARHFNSQIVLLHVATGWAARLHKEDAVSPEITQDTQYLQTIAAELQAEGIPTEIHLAYGEPAREIVNWVRREHCDLIAMSTHGHRFLADLFLGTTAHTVQHRVDVPVLLIRAKG